MNLTDFLLARITEDERWVAPFAGVPSVEVEVTVRGSTVIPPEGFIPELYARMLAECQAKRAIIERTAGQFSTREMRLAGASDAACAMNDAINTRDNGTLRILAAVYANHPDYRDEWRP